MNLTIPDAVERVARELSSRTGEAVDSLLLRVLEDHFRAVPQDLAEEMAAWELGSDRDAAEMDEKWEPAKALPFYLFWL